MAGFVPHEYAITRLEFRSVELYCSEGVSEIILLLFNKNKSLNHRKMNAVYFCCLSMEPWARRRVTAVRMLQGSIHAQLHRVTYGGNINAQLNLDRFQGSLGLEVMVLLCFIAVDLVSQPSDWCSGLSGLGWLWNQARAHKNTHTHTHNSKHIYTQLGPHLFVHMQMDIQISCCVIYLVQHQKTGQCSAVHQPHLSVIHQLVQPYIYPSTRTPLHPSVYLSILHVFYRGDS